MASIEEGRRDNGVTTCASNEMRIWRAAVRGSRVACDACGEDITDHIVVLDPARACPAPRLLYHPHCVRLVVAAMLAQIGLLEVEG